MKRVFIIRAIGGGELSNTRFLSNAYATYLAELHRTYQNIDMRLELIGPEDVKIRKWTPAEAVDWLLSGSAHIVSTHIHQGVGDHLGWNYTDLMLNLARLRDHPGFPNGMHVMCPVFQQDKYSYLEALLPYNHIIPTLKVTNEIIFTNNIVKHLSL
jgi:hypothetical protein